MEVDSNGYVVVGQTTYFGKRVWFVFTIRQLHLGFAVTKAHQPPILPDALVRIQGTLELQIREQYCTFCSAA